MEHENSQREITEASFRAYLSEHRLMGSRCQSCGALFLPPRPLCPRCYSEDMTWQELGPEGKLAAYTAVYIGLTVMVEAGYDRTNPYVAGIVEMAEGPRISAQILGVDATRPDEISVGMPLRVAFIDRELATASGDSRRTFLAFQPR